MARFDRYGDQSSGFEQVATLGAGLAVSRQVNRDRAVVVREKVVEWGPTP
jgi:hypothetical protein